MKNKETTICLLAGVFYAGLLLFLLRQLNSLTPMSPSTDTIGKMLFTGTCASLAVAIVFIINSLLLKQEQKYIGLACSISAFIYFYIIKLWSQPTAVFNILTTSYSLFAFFAFTISPLLVGLFLNMQNRKKPSHC